MLQVVVTVNGRQAIYSGEQADMEKAIADASSSLVEAYTDATGKSRFPVQIEKPVLLAVSSFNFIRLFLNNVFFGVQVLLILLGSLVIYSLLLGDVEAKTYEYGMLRTLGMRHQSLTKLLILQSALFTVPALLLAMVAAYIVHIPIASLFSDVSGMTVNAGLPPVAWSYGLIVGISIPLASNIVPVRRALSKTLRDALDLYRQVASEIIVKVQKLATLGLSPATLAISMLLVVIGIVTYYVLPLAFVFGQFGLFLSILMAILLSVLLGLSLLSQMVQPYFERLLIRTIFILHRSCLCCCRAALGDAREAECIEPIILRNLKGHRNRNRKTAYLLSIGAAFLIFAGSLFALQARVITINVAWILGADIVVTSTGPRNALDEDKLKKLLANSKVAQMYVEEFSFVSFPLERISSETLTYVAAGTLAMFPVANNQLYGVSKNFLRVAYDEFAISTRIQRGTDLVSSSGDIIEALHSGQGAIELGNDAESGDADTATSQPDTVGVEKILSTSLGSTPRCKRVCKPTIFFQCKDPEKPVITKISFASYGSPQGACNVDASKSRLSRDASCHASRSVQIVERRCLGRGACSIVADDATFGASQCLNRVKELLVEISCGRKEDIQGQVARSSDQPAYYDVVMSEAMHAFSSVDIDAPIRFDIGIKAAQRSGERSTRREILTVYGRPRAFMSKMPAFGFSSYQFAAQSAPVLLPMRQLVDLLAMQ